MSIRQQKFIEDLQKALLRIQNKTYGVCIVTGELIAKERLRVVPHATKSVDGKNIANKNKPSGPAETSTSEGGFGGGDDDNRPTGKPVSDQVRMSTPKRSGNSDEWEPDNETMEDAGYRNPPPSDDDDA